MKTIGLIGGMSWRSSQEYYRIINEVIQNKLGGWHSAKILMYSVDFNEIDLEHHTKDWKKSENILIDAAKSVEKGGADFIVICANTAHVLADTIQKSVKIPVLHIADATAERIKSEKIINVGLLGTRITTEEGFYKKRLEIKYGLNVIIPQEKEREIVGKEINNLCLGKTTPQSKQRLIKIINNLVKNGAEAVILGCTELSLVLRQKDVKIPLFDTTRIHAETAAEHSLS
ncbi:MAG: aspartate/glutamate racemase family protein [Candidatus Nealsonbacteria bacterium]